MARANLVSKDTKSFSHLKYGVGKGVYKQDLHKQNKDEVSHSLEYRQALNPVH